MKRSRLASLLVLPLVIYLCWGARAAFYHQFRPYPGRHPGQTYLVFIALSYFFISFPNEFSRIVNIYTKASGRKMKPLTPYWCTVGGWFFLGLSMLFLALERYSNLP